MGYPCENSDCIHIVVTVNAADNILTVKEKIQDKTAIKPEFQRLAGNGMELSDERTLEYYNIRPRQTLWMVYPREHSPGYGFPCLTWTWTLIG